MKNKSFTKKNILTIPNLLSMFRLLLIPVIVWLYCERKQYHATVVVIALSGFTDILDGKIARKFNMVSDVGKVLDPIADKLTQAALVICLITQYPWMWALLTLFIIREGIMAWWGYLALKHTDTVNSAKWYGKAATVVLYAVMILLVFFSNIPDTVANVLMLLCAVFMLLSLVLYGKFYRSILKPVLSEQEYKQEKKNILKISLAVLWVVIFLFFLFYWKSISPDEIVCGRKT